MRTIIVVGAGPAGMMAAVSCAGPATRVTVIEKNASAGKKLLLSGKGRCNLTNTASLDLFLQRFPHGQFLRDAFARFFNNELISFFERAGLKLKVERQQRVFPVDDSSASVLRTMERQLAQSGVTVIFKKTLTEILVRDGAATGVVFSDGSRLEADRVILATGGASYAFTGSDGQGMRIAARLGHTVVPLRPGLVPLVLKKDFAIPEGLTLRNIRLEFVRGKKKDASEVGELLFTAKGISGPLVLTWSGRVVDWLAEGPVVVSLDLKPGLSREQLARRFLRDCAANPKKGMRNLMKEYLPMRMLDIVLSKAGIPAGTKANQVTRDQREALIGCLKGFRMEAAGSLPLEEAMVTRGGVSLKEINPRTMESRLVKGLYFCGEVMDIDADTGGFNLQAAFSTGWLAGLSAAA